VTRVRLDQLLVDRALAPSRAAAQALLLAGEVELVGAGTRVLKPGQLVDREVLVSVVARPRWASRGGDKLAAALDAFEVDPAGLACLDAGASTGGFTDVLLTHQARVVYAVDVGRGQLLDRLAKDPRVVSMERTNLRTLRHLPEPIDLATLDLSFISLGLVLAAVRDLLTDHGRVIALVKPQFEAGRGAVPRGGVVREAGTHRAVLLAFADDAHRAGYLPANLISSPIVGADGNREFLALLTRGDEPRVDWERLVDRVVPSPYDGRSTMAGMKRKPAPPAEQLSVFAELAPLPEPIPEPAPDTMRQIVSLRMPDALLERVEEVARGRGVSPSGLMRALIAAGLDRSYAAVTPDELAAELAALRRGVDEIASRLRTGE
jgi:23S rRNA (cytidine1920-2'-O)/16S rRNA (cytidine1409-2'-O)-methyltransferase